MKNIGPLSVKFPCCVYLQQEVLERHTLAGREESSQTPEVSLGQRNTSAVVFREQLQHSVPVHAQLALRGHQALLREQQQSGHHLLQAGRLHEVMQGQQRSDTEGLLSGTTSEDQKGFFSDAPNTKLHCILLILFSSTIRFVYTWNTQKTHYKCQNGHYTTTAH